ncbi:protein SIEVE ELEMENT OCCLUSION B-like [Prosopis cineraria]|uniref:protein SIEVE ELEMENT OCCLUSION B-like n=1 Tax=Prosopis cineraria TaxID=364024 RepID=UPI00241007DE|nr:protein SIEVE ELEMENT OCCLUSION B-like [Prosopis cineraria]
MASQESSYAMPPLTQSIKNVLNFGYDESGDIKPTNQTLNVEALFMVVSNIMEASFKVSDPNIKLNVNKEDKATLSGFKSPIERLQKIACQMRRIVPDAAQETTVKMMTDLRKEYPWHAIAVMALAGFALDYGNFHLLSQVKDGEHLGTSLAVLNDVQAVVEGSVKETVSKYNSEGNVGATRLCRIRGPYPHFGRS